MSYSLLLMKDFELASANKPFFITDLSISYLHSSLLKINLGH